MLQTDDIQQELMAIFQPELEEHLETLNKGLLALEQGPEEGTRMDLLSTVFRSAHSIKGAARAVGLEDIEAVAHKMEDALGQVRKHKSPLLPAHVDALLASVDAIRDIMEAHLRAETFEPAKINALFARLDVVTHEVENEIASQASPGKPPASAAAVPAAHLPSVHAASSTESKRETLPFESDIFDPIPNTVKPDLSSRFTPTGDSGKSIPARAVAKVGTVLLTSETDKTAIPYTPPRHSPRPPAVTRGAARLTIRGVYVSPPANWIR